MDWFREAKDAFKFQGEIIIWNFIFLMKNFSNVQTHFRDDFVALLNSDMVTNMTVIIGRWTLPLPFQKKKKKKHIVQGIVVLCPHAK